jgi:thiamine biosynthesis protein ThiS
MKAPANTITIKLDGQSYFLPVGLTLAALVEQLGHVSNAVSTAVNGQFVSRQARENYTLTENDQVVLFQPIVGG